MTIHRTSIQRDTNSKTATGTGMTNCSCCT